MIDEHLDHGRHQQRIGDAEALHRLGDSLRREALDDHASAAVEQRAVHAPAIGDVKHRRRVQIDSVGRKQTFGHALQRGEGQIAVAERDPFRAAGRAAGVEDAGGIVPSSYRVGDRRCRSEQRLIAGDARRSLALVGVNEI